MRVLLDSSFIISCVRKKIDFINDLKAMGFRIIVPKEVIQELKDLKTRKGKSRENKLAIDIGLGLIERGDVGRASLGGNKVDDGLIIEGKNGAYIASLDVGIKRNVPNRVIISRSKKGLVIDRF